MNCNFYRIPYNLKAIWKMGKKRFQIWNALYYLAAREQKDVLEITPYMLKSPPFNITDIKKKSLYEYLDEIVEADGNVQFDRESYSNQKRFFISVKMPEKYIAIPSLATKNSVFKGKTFKYHAEIPCLLFMFSQISFSAKEIDSIFSGHPFIIKNSDLILFFKELGIRSGKPVNLLESLKGKKILKYNRIADSNDFEIGLTFDVFLNCCRCKKLKFRVGRNIEPLTETCFKELRGQQSYSRTSCNTDYILIADTIGKVTSDPVMRKFINMTYLEFIDKLNEQVGSWEDRGRFSLRNGFKEMTDGVNLPTAWFDLSLTEDNCNAVQKAEIPLITYSHFYIFHYFYPGSLAHPEYDNLDYVLSSSLMERENVEKYRFSLLNNFRLNNLNKVFNAYRGPVMCCFPKKAVRSDGLMINVEEMGGFRKLNMRILALLVPENKDEVGIRRNEDQKY